MPESRPLSDFAALSERLAAWSRAHAVLLALGTALAALRESLTPLLALGSLSFGALLWSARGRFTSAGSFGPANTVTLLRLGVVLGLGGALGALSFPSRALLAGLTLGLDGLDGWIARKTGRVSAFGAHFDMETDAFFVLVMTLLLWTSGRLEAWILCGGVLRPAYVLWLWALPAPNSEEPRSNFGRLAFFCLAGGLICALASTAPWAATLAAAGTVAVTLSFARSARYWYRARARAR